MFSFSFFESPYPSELRLHIIITIFVILSSVGIKRVDCTLPVKQLVYCFFFFFFFFFRKTLSFSTTNGSCFSCQRSYFGLLVDKRVRVYINKCACFLRYYLKVLMPKKQNLACFITPEITSSHFHIRLIESAKKSLIRTITHIFIFMWHVMLHLVTEVRNSYHYENTPIQIHLKFHHQKLKLFR